VDGVFGPNTESKTKAWQKSHKLDPDGIVGPRTRKAAMDEIMPGTLSTAPGTVLADASHMPAPLMIAAHYTWANRSLVHWIVLHSMEAPEKPTTAEAVARWIAGRSGPAPDVSFHWGFDNDSSVQSVPEEHVAWHALRANRFGIGYEHAGYARQSRAEWLDDYSESMLWLSARVAATTTCPRWNIPTDNVVDAAGLKRAYSDYIDRGLPVPNELRGFTTHASVTKGLGGSHTDPGVDFPMDEYLDLVKQAA
jgi:N-acetyl-anhydromuramyl-L-alanine amidase AmpD